MRKENGGKLLQLFDALPREERVTILCQYQELNSAFAKVFSEILQAARNHFSSFTDELLWKVLLFLNPVDLVLVSRCDKRMHNMCHAYFSPVIDDFARNRATVRFHEPVLIYEVSGTKTLTLQVIEPSTCLVTKTSSANSSLFLFYRDGTIRTLKTTSALDTMDTSKPGTKVIEYAVHEHSNQKWYVNPDGSIFNPITKYQLSVTPGQELVTLEHPSPNFQQRFILVYPFRTDYWKQSLQYFQSKKFGNSCTRE